MIPNIGRIRLIDRAYCSGREMVADCPGFVSYGEVKYSTVNSAVSLPQMRL
jgi:hypothetical protein